MHTEDEVWGPEDAGRGRRKPLLVIVDHRTGERTMALVALAERGWRVHSCAGPPYLECPVLEGKECLRAFEAEVIVLSVAHPKFAELLHVYRSRVPSAGIVLLLPQGRGATPELMALADAVATLDETPVLPYAAAAAARAAQRRAELAGAAS